MSCEHHVSAPLKHLDLVAQRARCPTQVGVGNHVEDHVGPRSDRLHERTGVLLSSPDADADVERQRTLREVR